MAPKHTVADVLEMEQLQLKSLSLTSWHYRALQAIRRCRTKAMGGHIDKCDCCHGLHISYNSCRNRHCPTCQGHKREEWIRAREDELLNVPYFHVVFTLPSEFDSYALGHGKIVYGSLFRAAWQTLQQFGDNPKHLGGRMGMIAVLHTWGQNMSLHPHLHCIVPGGGLSKSGQWKKAKNNGNYLFNVKSMSQVFRAKYIAELRKSDLKIPQKVYNAVFGKKWVVYAKQPFRSPKYVIEYLGRYTHKIAISNHRITNIDRKSRSVTFTAKDYRRAGKKVPLTLSSQEFIRRFALHILPKGFTRIRHYGILSSSWKKEKLPQLQAELATVKLEAIKTIQPLLHRRCPVCKKGTLHTILLFNDRGPPENWRILLKDRKLNRSN
ncbi:IS91 family transposase [Gelidibacter japonicus]|uniref:IS91 family transposase n=1 Tax=Gelidibacter japonicus TaxID=1962232 RepID=UPI002B00379D|nr:IS91 family transposase [Gelidibacter japonicus]